MGVSITRMPNRAICRRALASQSSGPSAQRHYILAPQQHLDGEVGRVLRTAKHHGGLVRDAPTRRNTGSCGPTFHRNP
jgi:hypothetical protein